MFDQIDRVAAAHRARAVTRIHVVIGEFAGVDRDLFATAYDVIRTGTRCERAALHIAFEPASDALTLEQLELEVA